MAKKTAKVKTGSLKGIKKAPASKGDIKNMKKSGC